jgi:hypothetical protein
LKKKIYFAHPYAKWGTDEEERIIQTLEERGYEVIEPFREKEVNLEKEFGGSFNDKPNFLFAEKIVNQDLELLQKCNDFLAWLPASGRLIGASIEFAIAFNNNMYIISICEAPHPFIYHMSNELYLSIDDFNMNANQKQTKIKCLDNLRLDSD